MTKEQAFKLAQEFVLESPYKIEFSETGFPEIVYVSGERRVASMIEIHLFKQVLDGQEEIDNLRKKIEVLENATEFFKHNPWNRL